MAVVTFKVVNGSWNDETTEDIPVVLTGKEGDTLLIPGTAIITATITVEGTDYTADCKVTVVSEGHKGNRCTVVIPKGTDTMSLVDKNGFTGFLFLGGKFGMKTN